LLYNNAQYSLSTANLIYTNQSPYYDRWSVPSDGTSELDTLLSLYQNVLLADGSWPSRNPYPAIKKWLLSDTSNNVKNLFFTSQDYGCVVGPNCADITFSNGSFEYDYLGISQIGPQDVGSTTRPFQLIPQPNEVTNYLIKYNSDSATSLWHYPTFELNFSGYPDAIVLRAGVIPLFKDGSGNNVLGVRNSGSGFNTIYCAFDVGALQFRSDTSVSPANDPRYKVIRNVESLANVFFDKVTTVSTESDNNEIVTSFALSQNYPNPFNPATTIKYSLPTSGVATIKIFDILGREIKTLVNEHKDAGEYSITFNAFDLPSGIYFYQLRAGTSTATKKMLLLK